MKYFFVLKSFFLSILSFTILSLTNVASAQTESCNSAIEQSVYFTSNGKKLEISATDIHFLINNAIHHSLLIDPVVITWPVLPQYIEDYIEQMPVSSIRYAWSGIADTTLLNLYNRYEDSLKYEEVIRISPFLQSFCPIQRIRFNRIDHDSDSSYEHVPPGHQSYFTISDFYVQGNDLYFILGINSLLFVDKPKDAYHRYILAHAEICDSNYFTLTELIAGTTFQVPEGNTDPLAGRPIWRIPNNPCPGKTYKK